MLLQMVFGRGYVRNISPHGVYTDIIDVDISDSGNLKTPVGVFNGKTSSISTPRFINDEIEAIYVTFNFLEKDGGDYQVLFSNCGALTVPYTVPGVPGKRTSSVEILLDKRRQEIIFIGKTDDVAINSVISRVPYSVSSRSLTDFSKCFFKGCAAILSICNLYISDRNIQVQEMFAILSSYVRNGHTSPLRRLRPISSPINHLKYFVFHIGIDTNLFQTQ